MRIYVSGPITGHEDTARRRFKEAVAELLVKYSIRKEDVNIIDPFWANSHVFDHFQETPSHDDYMITSMAMLSLCDAIYMMDGWLDSEGCKEEYEYAIGHGYKIFYQTGFKK